MLEITPYTAIAMGGYEYSKSSLSAAGEPTPLVRMDEAHTLWKPGEMMVWEPGMMGGCGRGNGVVCLGQGRPPGLRLA